MQAYFIRHGQTNYNLQSLCNDDPSKDVHLTDTGIQQAQQLAEEIKHIALEKIFVSELPRTRQTANIINQYHQAGIERNALINDIKSGFDSQPVKDYQQAIAPDPLYIRCNDGESLIDHKLRVLRFIEWLGKQAQTVVLVVAHEETLRVIKAHFEKLDDIQMLNLSFNNCACLHYAL